MSRRFSGLSVALILLIAAAQHAAMAQIVEIGGKRNIFVMRHLELPVYGGSPDRNAALLAEAKKAAVRIRTSYLFGVDFSYYGHSPAKRCLETFRLLRPEHAEKFVEVEKLGQPVRGEWAFAKMPKDQSVDRYFAAAPELFRAEGERVWTYVQSVALKTLKDGQSALLCADHPLVEAAIAAAKGRWPPEAKLRDFDPGDAVVFHFLPNGRVDDTYLPAP